MTEQMAFAPGLYPPHQPPYAENPLFQPVPGDNVRAALSAGTGGSPRRTGGLSSRSGTEAGAEAWARRHEEAVAPFMESLRSNQADPMFSAFSAQMNHLYQVFKELYEQDQVEIRQLLTALESQKQQLRQLASENNTVRQQLLREREQAAAAATAAATRAAAAAAAAPAGPAAATNSNNNHNPMRSPAPRTTPFVDAAAAATAAAAGAAAGASSPGSEGVQESTWGMGTAGSGGRGARARSRLHHAATGGAATGTSSEDGSRRSRGAGAAATANISVSGSQAPAQARGLSRHGAAGGEGVRGRSGGKGGGGGGDSTRQRPLYILFLPYMLHPAHHCWRFYAAWLHSWSTRRTAWLAVLWLLVFLLAVGLLVGLLVPWGRLTRTRFLVGPQPLAVGSSELSLLLRLNRDAVLYYAVVPEAYTSGGTAAAAAAGRRRLSRSAALDSSPFPDTGTGIASAELAGLRARLSSNSSSQASPPASAAASPMSSSTSAPASAPSRADGWWSGCWWSRWSRGQLQPQHRVSWQRRLRQAHRRGLSWSALPWSTPAGATVGDTDMGAAAGAVVAGPDGVVPEREGAVGARRFYGGAQQEGRSRRQLLASSNVKLLALDAIEGDDVRQVSDGGEDSDRGVLFPYTVACGVVHVPRIDEANFTLTVSSTPSLAALRAVPPNGTNQTSAAAAVTAAAAAALDECTASFGLFRNSTIPLANGSYKAGRCQRCPLLQPGTPYVVLLLADGGRTTGVMKVRVTTRVEAAPPPPATPPPGLPSEPSSPPPPAPDAPMFPPEVPVAGSGG
ncbi:hypothetical protein Agub_g3397 [Astrephomene gubernaculifera]|uniref:Uncharacterized protein n=1 Tax=Astrephomene gubernaculifera TaxID=47775 RepID=A0AAD3DL86_9CHLO|nr:hypothetical protein Agub_g3397 [Astrephomene gubernaculifera]